MYSVQINCGNHVVINAISKTLGLPLVLCIDSDLHFPFVDHTFCCDYENACNIR